MNSKHLTVFASALVGIALQIGSLPNFHAALTPTFISGVILVVGSVLGGTYTQPPTPKA